MNKFLAGIISLFALCIIAAYLVSCDQAATPVKTEQKAYVSKGDASDLVYNPIRSDGSIDSSFLPILTLDETVFDFGTINQGDIAEHTYTFKNTGTAPLLVQRATSSCGCTVPEWSTVPIEPGGTGFIKVKFDSTDKEGPQTKEVTIFANTIPNQSVITIKGIVHKMK